MNTDSTKDALAGANSRSGHQHEEEEEPFGGNIMGAEPILMSARIGGNAYAPYCERPSQYGSLPVPGCGGGVKSEISGASKQTDLIITQPTPPKAGAKASWAVEDDTLEALPIDFPLEKTSRFVSERPSVVANRVSECLFLRSIDAKFNNSKAIAKCSTLDFVRFRIRLFAPRSEEDGPGTIIEVQKRRGDTISFLKDCRAILYAAEGDGADLASETVPIHINQPVSKMACAKGVEMKEEESIEEIIKEAIESSVDLIQRDEMDLHVLAFESLVALVDPLKTVPGVSLRACKIIVAHDSQNEAASEIRGAIAALLRFGALHQEDGPGDGDAMVSDFNETLKNLSLCLLSRTFATMLEEKCLELAIQENNEWFVDTLVPPLVDTIKNARDHPHDALYAAECLSSLVSSSKDVRRRAELEDALGALEDAKEYGSVHHSSLESASSGSISLLKCSC
mmetsp:Transcript_4151/g.5627  ORF Transcript_4151/g.5627 Transcript_4151/m.5627 type:complete len:453 (-) Transcript_4151:341-1699(-)|eukprot:CAMPEP_0185724134 /NCGR_PEP_ID=MMETSP1171-20130828/703_1 /TAXON_ID=374046 /ORGANISM="Helicotheca tamensis, Strain CCMP826" /LENGTH=452 /DNA_ID=CAMNT_0028391919 /DNA_START=158 /DNA_END=1516 /DNA_ORIENTATION=+